MRAENPKYLPRLGPSPIRFYAPDETPVPFLLPPLDLGEFEEDKKDDSDEQEGAKKESEEKTEPHLRTRETSISSRPHEIEGPSPGSYGSSGAADGSLSPYEAAAESLLPDGFDIDFDGASGDRRDLSLFLNYFVGQSQKKRNSESKNPAPEGAAGGEETP